MNNDLITVKMNMYDVVDMLVNRLNYWTDDKETKDLYRQMYTGYAEGGCFDGMELDVNSIVDNDYINYCQIINKDNEEFDKLLKIYKEQGIGDCSCEHDFISFIEAVDNEEEPTVFLVRY